ncbi:indole-3-glycerol phosphate synthase TrpC [bacterium]|nr:indole-3-glycerol phosphate synthase TrpC [bacterium]
MNILEEIIKAKRNEVEYLKSIPLSFPSSPLPPRDFKSTIQSKDIALIGELKKCSPSAGVIREDFNAIELAKEIELGGASALSVLTDYKFFCGSLALLPVIKMETNLPILMKDFLIDEFQIELAEKLGADAILLIARCLTRDEINRFLQFATEKGLQCLVEIHDKADLEKIKNLPIEIVGINSRDLSNFKTNLENVIQLKSELPDDVLIVAESGIKDRRDIETLMNSGIRAFLVGEALMRAENVREKVRELLGDAEG